MVAQILHTSRTDYSELKDILSEMDIFSDVIVRNQFEQSSADAAHWWFLFPTFDEAHLELCSGFSSSSSNRYSPIFLVTTVEKLSDIIPCLRNQWVDYLLWPLQPTFVKHRILAYYDYIRLNERARHIETAKSSILSTLNHDIRNALTSINGLSDVMIEEGVEDQEELEFIARSISSSGHKLLRIVNEMQERYSSD